MHNKATELGALHVVCLLTRSVAGRVLLSKRMLLVMLVEIMPLWDLLSPIGDLVVDLGYRVGPWLFTFIAGDPVCQAFFVFGLVFLLADAPFVSIDEAMVVVRTGRIRWVASRLVAIIVIVIGYYGCLLVLSWLCVAPWMTFTLDGWGTVIITRAETDAAQVAGMSLSFDAGVVNSLSPLSALGHTFGFEVLGGTLLGLVISAVNACTGTRIGLAPAAFIVLFDLLALNTLPYVTFNFSPISHARIQLLDFAGTSTYLPAVQNAFLFDLFAIVVVGAIAAQAMRRMDIQPQARG